METLARLKVNFVDECSSEAPAPQYRLDSKQISVEIT
jgi:hypothetical protein